jgi:hypothetical protein
MRVCTTELFDRHKRMRSGDFPRPASRDYACAMSSQHITSHSRTENSADLARVLVALGLLALLASFDGSEGAAVTAQPASAADTKIQSQ